MGVQQPSSHAYLPSDNPTSLKAWFRNGVGVTSSGGVVSQWDDQSGNGNHLLQATGTKQPAYDGSAIITFDGVDDFMKCTAFTLNQPEQVMILMNFITASANKYFFDGNEGDSGECQYANPATTIAIFAGGAVSLASPSTGSYTVLTGVFNGASSSLALGNGTPATGNAGASNMSGFTIGSRATGGNPSNIAVKEIIVRNVDDATIRAADLAYLLTL